MNSLRNIFANRTLTQTLRQNGQNLINQFAQPPVEGNSNTNNNTNAPVAGKPLKPLIIPRSILNANALNKKLNSNVQPGGGSGLSPTTLKRFRHMDRKMELVYRCKLCHTRNKKFITEAAYKTGIVIIQCDGCAVNHLIVDNLGWFTNTKGKSFDQVLAERNSGKERIQVIKVNEKGDLI